MLETIYIARHGFRVSWSSDHWHSITGLERDPPLSAYGQEQARVLAKHLASRRDGGGIERIYSSPYYRCLQTADPVSQELGVKIWVEHGIGEWYVPSKSRLPSAYPARELMKYFPETIDEGSYPLPILRPSLRGETVGEIHERAGHVVRQIIRDCDKAGVKIVLLVTHAATNIALGRALTGETDRVVNTGCCSLGKYTRRRDGDDSELGQWTCELNGDASFLENGQERNWQFDDISEYDEPGLGDRPDQSLVMWKEAIHASDVGDSRKSLLLFEKDYRKGGDGPRRAKY